jgi:bisphosphoglycerate-independent phosphoglycerate mutase (AlkP superfamily)
MIKDGKLADIAPTVCKILSIETPKEMDGNVLC